jgi:3-oxoacyl-(acyl-carrier-protein) synthase
MPSNKKRIVITGMGVNCPLGDNPDEFYQNLIQGKSGIGHIESFDVSRVRCKIGGDLGGYDILSKLKSLKPQIPKDVYKRVKKIFKTAPFATKITMLAAIDAYVHAGLFSSEFDKERMSVIVGGHNFNDNYLVRNVNQFAEEPEFIDGLLGVCFFDSDMAACVAESLQIYGPMYTIGGTCTSAGLALRSAIKEIRSDECDLALIGGGCIDYSPIGYQSLILINAISYRSFNDMPEKASRPYDTQREGFVPSHGSGMLIVESLDHAQKRDAHIYAEILSVEANSDGNHLPNPSTEGQTRVMKRALRKAGIAPSEVDYVNAHATSTPMGDLVEIHSLKKVFGAHVRQLKINATKSMIGHTGWTAHTVELIAGIMQMNHSCLHPSINIDEIDPEVDLDVCANVRVDNYTVEHLMKCSFGFGGVNCCTIARKWEA